MSLTLFDHNGAQPVLGYSAYDQNERRIHVNGYEVELSREGRSISYRTLNGPSSEIGLDSGVVVSERNVPIDPLDVHLLKTGQKPTERLTWLASAHLQSTDFQDEKTTAWSTAWNGDLIRTETTTTTWVEHRMGLEAATDWDNVERISATEHGSAALKWLGWGGAVALYLVGGSLLASQYTDHRDGKPTSTATIGTGAGLFVLSVPFLILGINNGDRDVDVYRAPAQVKSW